MLELLRGGVDGPHREDRYRSVGAVVGSLQLVRDLSRGIAARPSSYRDLAGLAQWLPDSGPRIDYQRLLACLEAANASTKQRTIYLLELARRADLAENLADRFPPTVPVWFGAARSGGRHNRLSRVLDAELVPLISGGTGA